MENQFGRFGKEWKFGWAKSKGFLTSKVNYLVKGKCGICVGFFFNKIGHQIGEFGEEIEV